jgi:hypothetical protein
MTFLKRKNTIVEASRFCEGKVAHIEMTKVIRDPQKAHFLGFGGKVGVIKLDPKPYHGKGGSCFFLVYIALRRKMLKYFKPNTTITKK